MIKFVPPYFSFSDDRGEVLGINNSFKFEEINLIFSKKQTVRGGHYHKYTTEMFFILEGKIKITLFHHSNPTKVQTHIVTQGQCFYIAPQIVHTFEMLEDSKWINMLDFKMDNTQKDFHPYQ